MTLVDRFFEGTEALCALMLAVEVVVMRFLMLLCPAPDRVPARWLSA